MRLGDYLERDGREQPLAGLPLDHDVYRVRAGQLLVDAARRAQRLLPVGHLVGQAVARLRDGMGQVHEGTAFLFQGQMRRHRLHEKGDHQSRGHGDGQDRQERGMPVPAIGEIKTRGQAQHLAGGKGGLDEAHYPAALLQRK